MVGLTIIAVVATVVAMLFASRKGNFVDFFADFEEEFILTSFHK